MALLLISWSCVRIPPGAMSPFSRPTTNEFPRIELDYSPSICVIRITDFTMSTISYPFSPNGAGLLRANSPTASVLLRCAVLTLLLFGTAVHGKTDEPPVKPKPRNIIAVFRLDGALTEVPADQSFALFGAPADSLKDMVARLTKAADDPAVKAVVLLPDSA